MSRPMVIVPSYRPQNPTISGSKVAASEDHRGMATEGPPEMFSSPNSSTLSKTVIDDSEADDSAEEEIVTAGAASLQILPSQRTALDNARLNVRFETHLLPGEVPSEEESEDSESESEEAEGLNGQPHNDKPRHVGFPPVEELPSWFPENIKHMYGVDRHGGALSYQVSSSSPSRIRIDLKQELNEITRYRAALEIIYRRKWRKYIQAGDARWKLQKALRHLKVRPLTKAFYKYRKEQFRTWKARALTLWKKLEKTHYGILILEETININFRQERIMHQKHLKEKRI